MLRPIPSVPGGSREPSCSEFRAALPLSLASSSPRLAARPSPNPTGAGGAGGQGGATGAGGSATAGSGGSTNDGSVGGADAAGGSDASIDAGGSPTRRCPDGTGGREDTSVVIDGDQADRVVTGDMTIVDSAADVDPGDGRRNRRRPLSGRSATAGPCQTLLGACTRLTRCKPEGGPASCATGICVYETCNFANQGKACKMPDGSNGTCCGSTCDKFDFTTDKNNCGGCGQVCPSGNCSNSACTDDCRPGCLTKGVSCSAGRVCMRPLNDANSSACMTASCAGLADGAPCGQGVEGICCSGACVNPEAGRCEHCGGCGIRCCSGTVLQGRHLRPAAGRAAPCRGQSGRRNRGRRRLRRNVGDARRSDRRVVGRHR